MTKQPDISQDEMNAEDKAAAAIAEAKALRTIRSSTSSTQLTTSNLGLATSNLGSLADILGLGPLSDTTVASIGDNDRETFISIHNRALEKFSTIATGEFFCMSDRSDEFHGVQTQYRQLGPRRDLVSVSLAALEDGKRNELRVLYGELCVDPLKFGRIYTVMTEANTEKAIALSIAARNFLSIDQSYARNAYPKGTKIALKQPRRVKARDGFKWLDVENPRSIVRVGTFPERNPAKFRDWLDNGGRAFDAEDWEACVRNYSKCEIMLLETEGLENNRLSLRFDPGNENPQYNWLSIRFQLYCKRSRAYIGLRRYDDAHQDAITCCNIDVSDFDDSLEKMIQGLRVLIESLVSMGNHKHAYWVDDNLSSKRTLKTKSLVDFYRQKCVEYYGMGERIVGIAEKPNYCKPDADFIGPVEIKNSINGHRGIFATEFVKAGTVLLICRVLARCDDYSYPFMHAPMANGLGPKVMSALDRKGNNALLLFLSLDPSSSTIFKTSIPTLQELALEYQESTSTLPDELIEEEYDKLDSEGILRILKTIAFDDMSPGNINNWIDPAEKRRYYGVWLLPSLINHSCMPNASRINVGDVMSIHATKDINEGEEITIPYFDVLLPYQARQAASKKWGFTCACKRCELEKKAISLDASKGIYEKLYFAFLETSMSKTIAMAKSSTDVEVMSKLSVELDDWLESLGEMLGEVGLKWIRSSFIGLYLPRLRLNLDECDRLKYEEKVYRNYLNNLSVVKEAVVATCPGDIRNLLVDWRNLETYKQIVGIHAEYDGFYERIVKVNKSCDSVYGCQNPKIVNAILRKLSKSSIF